MSKHLTLTGSDTDQYLFFYGSDGLIIYFIFFYGSEGGYISVKYIYTVPILKL